MKKLLFFILFLFVVLPTSAQGTTIYLPLILKMKIEHEVWKVISPVESTNYVLNPSGEETGNFSALGTATVARSTTYQLYGVYSYSVQTGANAAGITLTTGALTNAAHSVSFRVRGRLPNNLRVILGESIKQPELIENIDTDWDLYAAYFDANAANGRTEVRIIQQGNGLGNFYLDGVQVEPLAYWTTYIDGDQLGCNWNGSEHAATSTRSGKSLDGGKVVDLYKEYGFFVTKNIGTGMPSQTINVDEYAILPGSQINSIKTLERSFVLIGKFIAGSEAEIHANKKALHTLLKKDPRNNQLKWLVYHPNEIREINAVYSGGLEGDAPIYYENEFVAIEDNQWAEVSTFVEVASIQLLATNPYFYGVGNKVTTLDTNDSNTFRLVAGRLKSTGQWDALGPPNAAGTYTSVLSAAEDGNYVYFGGIFQNFDNIANADYIVRYDKRTGTYSALGTGMNERVQALVVMPNGNLIAGGRFTTAGGSVANYIAQWNGTSWSNMGSGGDNFVLALTVTKSGLVIAGGSFTLMSGVANTARIAQWDGTNWTALSTGMNSSVTALVISGTELIAGGSFTTAGGVSATRVANWDGTVWTALGTGIDNGTVNALTVTTKGSIIAGGTFTLVGGATMYKIAEFNGTSWGTVGSSVELDDDVTDLDTGLDGMVYVGGLFNEAGDLDIADRFVRWNGYSWGHFDINLPGSPNGSAILASKFVDTIIKRKYDLFLGFTTTGTGYYGGKVTVTNNGSSNVYPKIILERNGGTAVRIETIRNETTGKELLLNYSLLDGERLTIDLSPDKQSVISSYFGSVPDAILPNSDTGTWILESGNNVITSFVDNDNIAIYPSTVSAWVIWRDTFESFD